MDSLNGGLNHIDYAFIKVKAFKHAAYNIYMRDPRLTPYRNLRRQEYKRI